MKNTMLTYTLAAFAIISLPIYPINTPHRSFNWDKNTELQAQVRFGNSLNTQESSVVEMRNLRAYKTLSTFLAQPLESSSHIPLIGFSGSGGGIRASIATLGVLKGLEDIGLLGAVHYMAGVSGSIWTLAAWMHHKTSLDNIVCLLREKLKESLNLKNHKQSMVQAVEKKIAQRFTFSVTDIWGAFITNIFLAQPENNGHDAYLSDLAPQILSGDYPMPIFSSVIGETNPRYKWVELTPFEVGSDFLNSWIPSSAFGKEFKNGISFDDRIGESLGFILGMVGSLYAMSMTDLIDTVRDEINTKLDKPLPQLASILSPWWNDNVRFSPPIIQNWGFKIPSIPLANECELTLVDAGLAINLPFPPLMRRGIDVHIVCDASLNAVTEGGNSLHDVEDYASGNNYKLPHIDYDKITSGKISVIADENSPTTPIIIYLPNFQTYSTFKFTYTPEEFDAVYQGMYTAVVNNKNVFVQAINRAIHNKIITTASKKTVTRSKTLES